jgi:hypothetical protein
VREGLREVADQPAGFRVVLLRDQTDVVAKSEFEPGKDRVRRSSSIAELRLDLPMYVDIFPVSGEKNTEGVATMEKLVRIPCRISRSAFSDERVFRVASADGAEHIGAASVVYFSKGDRSALGPKDPPG